MEEEGKPGEDFSRRQGDEEVTPEKCGHDEEPGTKGVENKVGHIVPSLATDTWVHACLCNMCNMIEIRSNLQIQKKQEYLEVLV